MGEDLDGPADVEMVRVVHGALRRDLAQLGTVLRTEPPPPDGQRRAIADHVCWVLGFLREHHRSEDEGLFPVVRRRRPEVAAVLDGLSADHGDVDQAIERTERAAEAYALDGAPPIRSELVGALDHLGQFLLPHLDREEEVLPVVSAALTEREWRAIEHEQNVAPKSPGQLAREGHWLIDGASPADRHRVLGLVPPIPRVVLRYGYAPVHRRRQHRWQGRTGPRVQKAGRTAVVVPATPDAVWAVVVDLERVGEWSHECTGCVLLDGAVRAAPGVRFRGRNAQGVFRWGRRCEVIAADDGELSWRTVPTALYPDSTIWRIRVSPHDEGCVLEQTFEVVRAPAVLDALYARLVPAHRDRTAALTDDLRRLGALAAAPVPARP